MPDIYFLAVSIDEELKKLLHGVTIPQGGVLPHINSFLFKSKSGSADDQSQSAPKSNVSRSNTAPIARAPSALATKASSSASLKKAASTAAAAAASSA